MVSPAPICLSESCEHVRGSVFGRALLSLLPGLVSQRIQPCPLLLLLGPWHMGLEEAADRLQALGEVRKEVQLLLLLGHRLLLGLKVWLCKNLPHSVRYPSVEVAVRLLPTVVPYVHVRPLDVHQHGHDELLVVQGGDVQGGVTPVTLRVDVDLDAFFL